MGHLRSFGLNNFRVFNTETDFELRPITILTGTNSSGKSSMIKGLQVMKNLFSKAGRNMVKDTVSLDFLSTLTLNEISNLGGFSIVKNKDSESRIISFKLPFMLPNQMHQMSLKLSYSKSSNHLDDGDFEQFIIHDKSTKEELYNIYPNGSPEGGLSVKINFPRLYEYMLEFNEKHLFSFLNKEIIDSINKSSIEEKKASHPEIIDFLFANPQFWIVPPKHQSTSFMNPYIGFINDASIFKLEFNPEQYLFPFVFCHPSAVEKYLKEVPDNDKISIMSLLKKISDMNPEEKASFFKEFVLAEKEILKKFFTKFESNGLYSVVGNLDILEFIVLMDSSKALIDLAGKKTNRIDPSIPHKLWNHFIDDPDNIGNDKISNLNSFFQKNEINHRFIMLGSDSISNQNVSHNFHHFFEDFSMTGLEYSVGIIHESFRVMNFIPSIRTQQGRIYHQGSISYMNEILQLFNKSNINSTAIEFLKHYIKEFKIADDIEVKYHTDLLSSTIHLVKNSNKVNISDLGYGISQLVPILLRIAINISTYEKHSSLLIDNVWQPNYFAPSILVIEEPETNLHPALQSKLADLFVECYKKYNIQFIIETHSEYFIRKLQYKIAKEEFDHNDANIYYFNDPESEEYKSEVAYKINIEKNGILSRPFGTGFFDESNSLNMSLYLLTKDSLN